MGSPFYLLFVVGCVRQQGRYVEHDLIVLVCRVQGLSARGIRWRKNSSTVVRPIVLLLPSISHVSLVHNRKLYSPDNYIKYKLYKKQLILHQIFFSVAKISILII